MTWKLVGAAAMALAVAACGTQPGERTTGGAAAGAATGAGIGALGGPVGALAGAAIGAGAGAVTGAATSPSTLNLGAPPWDNPRARVPGIEEGSSGTQYSSNTGQYGYQQQHSSRTVRQAQRALQRRGFDPGPIDGIYGPQTASAIENFQRSNNMQADGQLDNQVLQALNVNQSGSNNATQTGSNNRSSGNNAMQTGSSNRSGNATGGGSGSNMNSNMNNTGMNNPGVNNTGSTGPGGTSSTGSGNQPGTGGTSQQSR